MPKDGRSYYSKISLHNKTPEEAARITEVFEANKNIAYKCASKYYKTQYWEFDEALQIALMGLWKACLIWDPNKFRLSTLAYNIINRDFMDFDTQQKKQPDILFNLEDNCVTEDLSLNDVLIDEGSDTDMIYEESESVNELTRDIMYILDDIAEDFKIPQSIVKLIYIVQVESTKDNIINMKSIGFIPKQTVKQVLDELRQRLSEIL